MDLAADFTRLRDEFGALREARATFVNELKIAVAEMRAGFFRAHTEMARKMKADLLAFRTNFKREAGEQQADRLAFINALKQGVRGQLQEFRAEMAGAHRAWFGPALGFEERFTTAAPFKSEKKSKRKSE